MTGETDIKQDSEEQREKGYQNRDHPHHFAGGWQGLQLDVDGEAAQEQTKEESTQIGCFARAALRFPRTYNIIFKVILPCLVLIALAFMFGAGLARLEWGNETRRNDDAMSQYADLVYLVDRISRNVLSAPERCLQLFEFGDTFNQTALEEHMKVCGERLESEEAKLSRQILIDYFREREFSTLTFDWMVCSNETYTIESRAEQTRRVITDWSNSYLALRAEYNESLPEQEAHTRARMEATGSGNCEPNASAGALFWFTIMTTIGYGNTSPTTTGGRWMIYTLGFCSILLFTALISQAGHVCVTILDDFFLRCGIRRLTQGIISVSFWAVSLLLWMLAIAGFFIGWADNRAQETFPLRDAYWFTFITATTVGLGDIFVPPELFKPVDMFFIPFLFLLAFVLLATFLLKFSVMVNAWLPNKGTSLASTLQKTRKEREPIKDPEGAPPDNQGRDASERSRASNVSLHKDQTNGDAKLDEIG